MFCIRRMKAVLVSLVALAAMLAVAAPKADAQVKPFKVSGGGLAPSGFSLMPGVPRLHWAVGVGTELGKYYGEGLFQITGPGPMSNQASFSSAPSFTFVAANGDRLVTTYGKGGTGLVTLTQIAANTFTANFVAEFNPIPSECTGRFKGVTGSWIMIAQSGPFNFIPLTTDTTPFAYTWQGEGTLTFPK